jgi:hypothetical protein
MLKAREISPRFSLSGGEMTPNPFAALLHSRKFWLMVLDLLISLLTYFVTKYVNPEAGKDVLYVVAALQPVFIVIIGAIAYEDVAKAQQ